MGAIIAVICLPTRRPAKKITAASLAKVLHSTAPLSLIAVVVVAAMPVVAPISLSGLMHATAPEESTPPDGLVLGEGAVAPPEYGVDDGELLTAAATIMVLAVFGSALGTLGSNKHLIRGIAYMLMPIIVVQAAFMLHLVGIIYFPIVVWIPMTAILLMLAVLAMVANRLIPDQTDDSATAPET